MVYHPALMQPSALVLSNRIGRLTQDVVEQITWKDKKYKLSDYKRILKEDPVLNAIVELKSLRATNILGEYTHRNEAVRDWVRGNFEDMEGTLSDFVSQAAIATFFGFFAAEIIWRHDAPGYPGEWRLKALNPLDVEKIKFEGTRYGIVNLLYSSNTEKRIPYQKAIHIARGSYDNDPYGIGLARRAIPYCEAKKVLLSEWVVAGKNHASGIFIGKADSNHTVQLLGPTGHPVKNADGSPVVVSAPEALLRQMEAMDSRSFIVTDQANQITWQPVSVDSGFYGQALQYLDRKVLLSQLAPSLTFEEGIGGLGNTGVASQQKNTLDSMLGALVEQVKDQLIEKVVRPLLVWNFGMTAKDGWGDFKIDSSDDPNMALQKASTIVNAIASQIIPNSDLEAINSLRELLGLSPQSEQEMMNNIQKNAQIQNLMAGGFSAAPPAEAPEQAAENPYP